MTKKNSVSIFLPVRSGSQRIKRKNTRDFAGVNGGLLYIKLSQLVKVDSVDEIVLSTNDKESIEVAEEFKDCEKLRIVERPEYLSLSNTNLVDLISYAPTICSSKHILWTHVTSPFVTSEDYSQALKLYFKNLNEGYDSLMSVKVIQNFFWSKKDNQVLNKKANETDKWPRTQDLRKMYEINSAIFVAKITIYLEKKDRVGSFPFLFEQNQLKSIDVDSIEDFNLAEVIFEKFK